MPTPVLAYLTKVRWPSVIPGAPFTASFATAIARSGVPVHLIVRSASRRMEGRGGDGLAVLRAEYGLEPPDNLRIHVINTPYGKPFSDPWIFFWRTGRLLRRLVAEEGVNVVMSRDTNALPWLARWRRHLGLPALHDSHNFYLDPGARDDLPLRGVNRRKSRQERRFLPRLDALLALLDVQAEAYREKLPGEVLVRAAHPGLWDPQPPDPKAYSRKTIGYVGSLHPQKGLTTILDSFARIPDREVRLLLIGGRGEADIARARALVQRLGLAGRVEITGWLPIPEMRRRVRELTISLLPLEDTFYNRYLTAPSKLFDALAAGVPLVASDLPAVRELAGEAAHYVPPGDPAALAAAVQSVLTDSERHHRLASSAAGRAAALHWDRRGEATRALLEEVLARSERPGGSAAGP